MSGVSEISATELAAWLADASRQPPLLLDVREGWEVATAAIAGSRHMPMNLIPLQMSELPDDVTIVTVCHHGVRSYHAGLFLANAGFEPVLSLKGGVDAWASEVDPTMAHY